MPTCVDNSRIASRRVLLVLGILTLGGCSGYLEQRDDQSQNAADVVRSADLQPRYPQAVRGGDSGGPQAKPFSFFGSNAPVAVVDTLQTGSTASADAKDGFTLNFENTPVASVAKAVLGDILGVGYVIDPRAQGTISLSSGRPIAKKDILFVLENALRANNLIMMRDDTGYRIIPANDGSVGASDQASGANGAEPDTELRSSLCSTSPEILCRSSSRALRRGRARFALIRVALS